MYMLPGFPHGPFAIGSEQVREARGRAVSGPSCEEAHTAALELRRAFSGVGAARFDPTITADDAEKVSFLRVVHFENLCRIMPDLPDRRSAHRWNVIIRPMSRPRFRGSTTRSPTAAKDYSSCRF